MREFIKWKVQQIILYKNGIKRRQRIKHLFGKRALDVLGGVKDCGDKDSVIELEYNKINFGVRINSTDLRLVESVLIGKLIDKQWRGEYYQALDYLRSVKSDVPIIIDAGANIGVFSIACLEQMSNCRIIAIEPEKENYELLKRNIGEKCNLIKGGLWSHSCNLEIIDRGTGNWGFMVKETSRNDDEVIEAFSIIDIINVFGLPRVDLLKLDIEGSEYDIFSHDYKAWLPYVNAIVIETHDNIIEGCEELVNRVLKNEGFILSEYEENKLFIRGSKL